MSNNWDYTVSSKHQLLDINLRELIRYRDLVLMFFLRDFTINYKQTILGPLWHIINPLLSTLVYAFVFGSVMGIGTDGIPSLLFYFGGTMLWTFFSTSLNTTSGIFLGNFGIFSKVYFPRLVVPIALSFSAILKMLIQFALLIIFLLFYIFTGSPVRPTLSAFLFPVLIIWLAVLGTGCGMVFSALTIKYRDLNNVLGLIMQLAMYVTPVVYPLSQVPRHLKLFFYINPVSAPMELFRMWFYGVGDVPFKMILTSVIFTVIVTFVGLILFSRNSRICTDVI